MKICTETICYSSQANVSQHCKRSEQIAHQISSLLKTQCGSLLTSTLYIKVWMGVMVTSRHWNILFWNFTLASQSCHVGDCSEMMKYLQSEGKKSLSSSHCGEKETERNETGGMRHLFTFHCPAKNNEGYQWSWVIVIGDKSWLDLVHLNVTFLNLIAGIHLGIAQYCVIGQSRVIINRNLILPMLSDAEECTMRNTWYDQVSKPFCCWIIVTRSIDAEICLSAETRTDIIMSTYGHATFWANFALAWKDNLMLQTMFLCRFTSYLAMKIRREEIKLHWSELLCVPRCEMEHGRCKLSMTKNLPGLAWCSAGLFSKLYFPPWAPCCERPN